MFTGIVEDIAIVRAVKTRGDVVRLEVDTALDLSDTAQGDSIAINGVCLTVVDKSASSAAFEIGPESLRVTALDKVAAGQRVHLERALALGGRLGGHLVQGHVDGVGTVRDRRQHAETLELVIATSPEVLRLCIHKGSITLDGVSLTINKLNADSLEVWLIPHTLERTVLGDRKVGARINIENDLIGKYVERLVGPFGRKEGVSWDLLAKAGFTS